VRTAVLREQFDYSWAAPTRRKALYQGLSRPMRRRRGANPDRRHCIKDGVFIDSGFQWLVYIPFVAAIAYWSDVDFYWLFFLSQLPDVLKAVVGWIIVKKEKWVKNLTITEGEAI